jgi:hypothetical protein
MKKWQKKDPRIGEGLKNREETALERGRITNQLDQA